MSKKLGFTSEAIDGEKLQLFEADIESRGGAVEGESRNVVVSDGFPGSDG